jgi:hypothetical protein
MSESKFKELFDEFLREEVEASKNQYTDDEIQEFVSYQLSQYESLKIKDSPTYKVIEVENGINRIEIQSYIHINYKKLMPYLEVESRIIETTKRIMFVLCPVNRMSDFISTISKYGFILK